MNLHGILKECIDSIVISHSELESILRLLRKLASKKLLRRILRHEKDKRRIDEAKMRLQHAFSRFHVCVVLYVRIWTLTHTILVHI